MSLKETIEQDGNVYSYLVGKGIPLENQRDVVALNRLIEEQERLLRVHIRGPVPCGIAVFNNNERYSACHLGIRFRDAYRRGKIRQPKKQYTLVEVMVIE